MTIYHEVLFGILFLSAASFIFQTSENERVLSKKSVPIRSSNLKSDMNKN